MNYAIGKASYKDGERKTEITISNVDKDAWVQYLTLRVLNGSVVLIRNIDGAIVMED